MAMLNNQMVYGGFQPSKSKVWRFITRCTTCTGNQQEFGGHELLETPGIFPEVKIMWEASPNPKGEGSRNLPRVGDMLGPEEG